MTVTAIASMALGGYAAQSRAQVCGDGTVEGGEVCDPPCEQGGCAAGEICSTDCMECIPDDDKVRSYAVRCYCRLGITELDVKTAFENAAGKFSCTDPATNQTVKRLDTTINKCVGGTNAEQECASDADCAGLVDGTCVEKVQAKDCTGIANCEEPGNFPANCDRPAWLDFPPGIRCYGHTYVSKWEITATKPRNGKSKVTVGLLCRHRKTWVDGLDNFDDINMIMHNSDNGETCWFQDKELGGGADLLLPHKDTTHARWLEPSEAASIDCIRCHDNGPWINSRWMFNSGINLIDGLQPYINEGFGFSTGQTKWKKPNLVTVGDGLPEHGGQNYQTKNKSCTSCHMIHAAEATPGRREYRNYSDWIRYTVGSTVQLMDPTNPVPQDVDYAPQSDTKKGQSPEVAFWMSPRRSDLADVYCDAPIPDNWGPIYEKHVNELLACSKNKGEKAKKKDGTIDKTDPCEKMKPRVGGCCVVATGVCTNDITRSECERTNDKYLGDGVKCSATNCPIPPEGGTVASAAVAPFPGVFLEADIGDVGAPWDFHSRAVPDEEGDCIRVSDLDPGDPPCVYTIDPKTELAIRWSADADHLNCFIAATFPAGVVVTNDEGVVTGTGSNWLLGESPQTIGVLEVAGDYYFRINCNDDDYGKIYGGLTFRIEGQSPTALRLKGIVNERATVAFDYPECESLECEHATISVGPSDEVYLAWVGSNVTAGDCVLRETVEPYGAHAPGPCPDPPILPGISTNESGFQVVALTPATDQTYEFNCLGNDGLRHCVEVTLQVSMAAGSIAWSADSLSPDRTTRSLRFSVQAPVTATSTPEQSAIKVTMVDLQHPDPRNLPQYPPRDFTTFDTGVHGTCAGATTGPNYNGHHCAADAECLGPNGTITTDDGTCSLPGPACTAIGETNPPTANGIGGCARWVGKPSTFYEAQGPPQAGPYRAARLECAPVYWDWASEPDGGLVTVVGAEIVPSSEYSAQTYSASCKGNEDTCTNVSIPVTMFTRRKGDLDTPYQAPSPAALTQADVLDISQAVASVKHTGPLHYRGQMQPNLPELNADANVLDIVEAVDSVKRTAYSFSGPCVCPSTVICGGPCIGCPGLCIKTCVGGDNDGDPCVNNTHCPGVCVGGPTPGAVCPSGVPGGVNCGMGGVCSGVCSSVGTCRDKCGRCSP